MRSRQLTAASIPLILLALSACSSLPGTTSSDADEAAQSVANASVNRLPVVETLVQEAAKRQNVPIPPAPPAPSADDFAIGDGDAISVEEIQPIVTTVPMTPNRIVERAINDYLQNRRGMLRVWVGRGHIYFPMIEQIFAEEGVPDELKYIALHESGLNPVAGSWAGAVGMWQFMAATARSEGLRVDAWVDERRDPEKSTRAAARHMLKLNESYNGRWHLSLAGYNCSFRCISRAVRNSGGTIDEPPSYWDVYTHLPQETRDFVPRYIATALIVSNPELYGIDVEELGQELAYDVVHVKGMLNLEEAARLAGTDLASIRNLNPELLKSSLPDDAEPYALKIPLGSYDRFVSAFARSAPAAKGPGKYVVKSGDTLGRIAATHDTSVAELQAVNGISGDLIRVNQQLLIPGMGGLSNITIASTERLFVAYSEPSYKPIKLSDEFQLVHQSGSTPDEPLLAVSLNQNMVEADEGVMSLVPTIYKVQAGDTLGSIAKRYGVSVASVQQGNNLADTTIFPNQELTIHSATNIVDPPQPGGRTYQVQQGDYLYQIARRFNITVDNLKRLNGLNSDVIFPGQSLQTN